MEILVHDTPVYVATGHEPIRPELPYVIFLHGAAMDHSVWVLFNRYFARNGYNSLAIDLPAHGKSGGEPLVSIDQMAQWLIDFMDQAGITQAAVAAHSMGPLIALCAAAKAPARFTRLIMFGMAVPMPVADPLLNAARDKDHTAIDIMSLYGHGYASQLGGNPVAGIHIVNTDMRILERHLNGPLFPDLNACNEYATGLDDAKKITCPVTLVLGQEDRMTPPANTRELIDSLQTVRVEVIPKCGHMMLAEQPEAVHQVLVSELGTGAAKP